MLIRSVLTPFKLLVVHYGITLQLAVSFVTK